MGYFLPLYQRHPIFNFLDPEKIDSDLKILREYFESNEDSEAIQLLHESDEKWEEYLEGLLKVRRLRLFNSELPIPDEENKIEEYAISGNELAIEMKKILNFKTKIPRTWPISEIEKQRERYVKWKKIPRMEEQAFNYLLYEALKVIYYPQFFFEKRIFKLEEEYREFQYDFLEFLGSEGLYIYYLIYKKEGSREVLEALINKYIPKPTIGVDVINLLMLFLWDGNDANKCNKFFTRRMKEDIYSESREIEYLINNRNSKYFEAALKEMFYADPSSVCNIRVPSKKVYNEPGLIEQAFLNHLVGNYASAASLLFSLIEGLIWDISVAEQLKNRNIYTSNSDLTTRDVRKRTLVGRDGSPLAKPHGYPTLRDLLGLTKMGDIINLDFLKMLIEEIYPSERNPILHGVKLDYNNPEQSSRTLVMLEYLHHLIKKQRYSYPEQLDEPGFWTPEKNKEEPPSNVVSWFGE